MYEPTAARVAQIQEDLAAATGPQNVHYDAVREVRARGAGFYQFSGDVEERTRQMDALRVGREETVRARGKAGAQDIQPGEVEGFKPAEDEGARKSRAMEKRKREIEERRKAVEAKRRKVKGAEQDESAVEDRTPNPKRQEYSVGSKPLPAVLSLEPYAQHAVDAALEVQISRKGKEKAPFSTAQAADDFLAQLERDMVQGQS